MPAVMKSTLMHVAKSSMMYTIEIAIVILNGSKAVLKRIWLYLVLLLAFAVFIAFLQPVNILLELIENAAKRDGINSDRGSFEPFPYFEEKPDHLSYRSRTPDEYSHSVVLLHGMRYSSSIWEELGTLDLLRDHGYRAIAVDLPEHGDSAGIGTPKKTFQRAHLLELTLADLHAKDAVIIAPSMSGIYALPLVLRGRLKLKGFVPIAPSDTERFSKEEYELTKIPTLIAYGSEEKDPLSFVKHLQHMPNSRTFVVEGARHACYVDKPGVFHRALLEFLESL